MSKWYIPTCFRTCTKQKCTFGFFVDIKINFYGRINRELVAIRTEASLKDQLACCFDYDSLNQVKKAFFNF